MVIGGGMIATAFAAFAPREDVVIFASGVSDSIERRREAFARERELLMRTRACHPSRLLVYFGTCSVADPDRRSTPYVRHKVEMEGIVAAAPGPWMVVRLPLAIGPVHRSPTLANFLYERIMRGEPFEVWSRSTRYPLDIEDAVRIVDRFIADRALWNRPLNAALRAFSVLDFVRILEAIVVKRANYTLVEKGAHYEVNCPELVQAARELQLDRSPHYLDRVLRKYFKAPHVAG